MLSCEAIALVGAVSVVLGAVVGMAAWAAGCLRSQVERPVLIGLQEPWLSEIESGRKTVECLIGPPGDCADWIGRPIAFVSFERLVLTAVVGVRHYATLEDYIRGEGFTAVAPHVTSSAEALEAYAAIRTARGDSVFSNKRILSGGGLNAIRMRRC